jgi:hypothetical protein
MAKNLGFQTLGRQHEIPLEKLYNAPSGFFLKNNCER